MEQRAKGPGDNIILRLKRDEKPLLFDWINNQSNVSDALRFLIELEITRNGIKNYEELIPNKRSDAYLKKYLSKEKGSIQRDTGYEIELIEENRDLKEKLLKLMKEREKNDNDSLNNVSTYLQQTQEQSNVNSTENNVEEIAAAKEEDIDIQDVDESEEEARKRKEMIKKSASGWAI